MIEHYFEDEMRYLQEAGKAFAEIHPDRARYLNADSLTDRDPHVERLFEGVAFLTARVREQLDDDLPQYSEGLLRLLYPHLVRRIPAASILQFTPRPGMVQETVSLPAGTEVRSRPVGDEHTPCRFITTTDVALQPVSLDAARLEWPGPRTSTAVLTFSVDRTADPADLDLSSLRLFFYADPSDASRMHRFFTRCVSGLTVSAGGQTVQRTGQQWVTPAGLRPEESLLPVAPQTMSGYRLLQEYFCYRPKFWFVDLHGLDAVSAMPEAASLTVRVHFTEAYPEKWAFDQDNLRLYCTPIVNLFTTDAEPVRVTHRAAEYRVIADAKRPESVSVYDIRRVVGTPSGTGRHRAYAPFFSFPDGSDRQGPVFSETARVGARGTVETYVSVGAWGAGVEALQEETLTPEVRCTNGPLPREALREGDITQPGPGFANVASFRNLTQPSRELLPPLDRHPDLYWMLLSHLALNRTSVLSREALRHTLRLYDWADTPATRRRIDGLRRVDWEPTEALDRGSIRRGVRVRVEVDDDHFADDGDLALFGLVLSRFLSMYATLNTFVQLTLTTHPSDRTLSWNPLDGCVPPL